jgi:hypothetical protein
MLCALLVLSTLLRMAVNPCKAPMKTNPIAPEQLCNAIARAERTAGWNFRDATIRTAYLAGCTVYVVPARLWACRRQRDQAAAFLRKRTG